MTHSNKHNFSLMLAGTDAPNGELSVTSPYTDQIIGTVAQCGSTHIEAALSEAQNIFRNRAQWLSVSERVRILENTAQLMLDESKSLAENAAAEGGKPLADSIVEVTRAIAGIKMCAEHISSRSGDVVPLQEPQPDTLRIGFRKNPSVW